MAFLVECCCCLVANWHEIKFKFNKPDEDLQYIGRKFVNKTIALKNFKINNHQDVSRAFNILHYYFNVRT